MMYRLVVMCVMAAPLAACIVLQTVPDGRERVQPALMSAPPPAARPVAATPPVTINIIQDRSSPAVVTPLPPK